VAHCGSSLFCADTQLSQTLCRKSVLSLSSYLVTFVKNPLVINVWGLFLDSQLYSIDIYFSPMPVLISILAIVASSLEIGEVYVSYNFVFPF
jgi:fumarate reductase subunit C